MSDLTDPVDAPVTVERWTYGGMRMSTKKTKLGEWIDPNGEEVLFKYKAGYITGCEYDVTTRRADGRVAMIGTPQFIGRSGNVELTGQLATNEKAHELELAVFQRMRKAKEHNPLDEAIDAVAELIKHLPAPRRAHVIAYITYRLSRSWRG